MTLTKILLCSLWLSLNIIVVGLTAYHLIKLEKEIYKMAVYNSTHTGQEIDNAVNKINTTKLYRYDINLAFTAEDSNYYRSDFSFYSSVENIGNNINDLMNAIFGTGNVSKYFYTMFTTKETGNNIIYTCKAIFKQYDSALLKTYYNIVKIENDTATNIVIEEVNNIEISKTQIM